MNASLDALRALQRGRVGRPPSLSPKATEGLFVSQLNSRLIPKEAGVVSATALYHIEPGKATAASTHIAGRTQAVRSWMELSSFPTLPSVLTLQAFFLSSPGERSQ